MFCATVMVHVDIDGKSSGRIHVALKLANWFSSDLIGISAAILPPYPAESGYFVTLEAIEREQRDVRAALARAEASFRSIATRPARIKPSVLPAFALIRCVGADQTGEIDRLFNSTSARPSCCGSPFIRCGVDVPIAPCLHCFRDGCRDWRQGPYGRLRRLSR